MPCMIHSKFYSLQKKRIISHTCKPEEEEEVEKGIINAKIKPFHDVHFYRKSFDINLLLKRRDM